MQYSIAYTMRLNIFLIFSLSVLLLYPFESFEASTRLGGDDKPIIPRSVQPLLKLVEERAVGLANPLLSLDDIASFRGGCRNRRKNETYAIIIGINKYINEKSRLRGSINDGNLIAGKLASLGVKNANIYKLFDSEANRPTIRKTLLDV